MSSPEYTPDEIQALQRELGLQLSQLIPEEEILRQLSYKVEQLLQKGTGPFFQLMYRLDIPERSLSAVIDDEHASLKIAKLIYDRQLQKIKSREQHRSDKKNFDADLDW